MTDEQTGSEAEIEEPTTEIEPDRREVLVESRVFLGIGTVVAVMAVIYLTTAYESAGSVMLILAAALSFVCGGYLLFHLRRSDAPQPELEDRDHAPYLPHASIWPFWIGVAAFLITNGLILGTWFIVPGALLLLIGMVGFVSQSRARS